MRNHQLTSVSNPPQKTAARNFHAGNPILDDKVVDVKLRVLIVNASPCLSTTLQHHCLSAYDTVR